jgi:hypothetical protein
VGPGNEVWEIRDAPPGEYKIYANLYDPKGNSNSPNIKGRVIFRDGSEPLPEVRLNRVKEKFPIATVTIRQDGSVTVR